MSKPAAPAQKFVPRSRYSGDGEGGPLGKGKGKGSMHSKEDKDEDGTTGRQGAWMGSRAKGGKGNKEHHRGPPGGGGGDDVKQEDTGKEGGRGFWQSHKASAPAPEGNDRFTGLGKYMAPGAKRREAEKEKEKERERDRHHDGDEGGGGRQERFFEARRGYQKAEQEVSEYPLTGRHPLACKWAFLLKDRTPENAENYDVDFIHLGEVADVEDFWSIYTHLTPPHQIVGLNYGFFLKNEMPVWEDHREGSRLIFQFSQKIHDQSVSSDVWEAMLLMMISQQFTKSEEVLGCNVRRGTAYTRLVLWLKTSDRETLKVFRAECEQVVEKQTRFQFLFSVSLNAENKENFLIDLDDSGSFAQRPELLGYGASNGGQ